MKPSIASMFGLAVLVIGASARAAPPMALSDVCTYVVQIQNLEKSGALERLAASA